MITPTALASFQLVSIPHSVHTAQESFKNLPHINSDLHLIHTIRGTGVMRLLGRRYITDPSCVMCVEPHVQCLYDKSPGTPWEMINLHIHLSASGNSQLKLPTRFTPANINRVHTQLRSILKHARSPDPLSKTKALAAVLALVNAYMACHATAQASSPDHDPLITRIRQQIDAQASTPIDVDALADQVALSRSQLTRRFKKETSLSVKQYWSQKRLAIAQSLLRETDWPLAQIADHLHFSDVFYLSRWFSTHARLSPSAYRKQIRAINH
jgi:AraC-like DNA-binding protein